MKIAYINLVYSKDNMIGVENKIIEEAKFFSKHGIDVYFLNRKRDGYEENVYFKRVDNYHDEKFFELYFRAFTFKVIENIVDLDAYDKIYLRYPLMDLSALSYAKRYGHKTITQHHGKELQEIKTYKIKLPFKIFQFINERFIAPYFFKHIYGLTAISDDLVSYEVKRVNFKGKVKRFSNGINPIQFTMTCPPALDKEFNLIMLSSSFSAWHGLDRLLKSLEAFHSDKIKINLYIVGKITSEFDTLLASCEENTSIKIHLLGKLHKEELDRVFEKAHIACDSLAMYRLDMHEGSTLKSKEYIARGIPFLYSAPDHDLLSLNNYLYDVKNEDSLIDFYKILKFYKKLDIVNMQKEMQKTTIDILSWDKKIENLKEGIFC
ncbi:MAG TPA: glycosyltransferase family 1 protein [Campylobacterales bacterium]|nr:glycosyltransferase family 1 protein [Campylobacterales bacterium]